MKKLLISLMAVLLTATQGWALAFTFSDKDFLGGASWGTLTLSATASDTLQATYSASGAAIIPAGSQVTGFGFNFSSGSLVAVTNPLANDFVGDRDDLNWIKLNNLSSIPQPTNGDEFNPPVTKGMYAFGATEGNANNYSPPGIKPGEFDVFFLHFGNLGTGFSLLTADLSQFVTLTGIRLQSLPNNINGGSLFLAGRASNGDGGGQDVIPEPSTLILLGAGLAGLGFWRRKKNA